MPLPQPKEEEEKNDFITRCVETPIMNEDFPKIMQRIAVCVAQWDNDEIENAGEVRQNKDCPDGYEHKMPNGKWMCGRTHPTKEGGSYGNVSYNDYPKSATNNAKRALKWVDENGWGSCGEATGKNRAHQLANGEPISRDTIARMASFKRHQQHKDVPYIDGCGGLMWDAWGGTSGVEWAILKLKSIDNKNTLNNEIYFDHEYNFTEEEMKELHDNGVLYTTQIDGDGTEMTIKFTYDKGEESDY